MPKDMPAFIASDGALLQSNVKKLKNATTFTWSVPHTAASRLVPGTIWLFINPKMKEMFLIKATQYVTVDVGESIGKTKVENTEIEGDYINRTFIKSDILETLPLSKDFLIPHVGASKGSALFNLGQNGKTRIIAIRNAVRAESPVNSKINEFLRMEEEELDDCIAYKQGNTWGFLFYTYKKDGTCDFNFEPVNNTNLSPTDDGYKDFVYFIFSHGYPKAIKIGRSDNPSKRLKGLDGSNPASISMLLILPDGRKEKMYHQKFKDYAIHGKLEWFWDDPSIRTFIKNELERYQKIKTLYANYLESQN